MKPDETMEMHETSGTRSQGVSKTQIFRGFGKK